MQLSPQDIRWVAHLARLQLSDDELQIMARQLGDILTYVEQLQQLPTDNVEPLAHPLDVYNVFRDDEPVASLPVEEALTNAPARKQSFFSVPAVLE